MGVGFYREIDYGRRLFARPGGLMMSITAVDVFICQLRDHHHQRASVITSFGQDVPDEQQKEGAANYSTLEPNNLRPSFSVGHRVVCQLTEGINQRLECWGSASDARQLFSEGNKSLVLIFKGFPEREKGCAEDGIWLKLYFFEWAAAVYWRLSFTIF
jgi:hypothetical protein